jgi:hypothetical protein
MEIRKRYIFLIFVLLIVAWLLQDKAMKYYYDTHNYAGAEKLKKIVILPMWQHNFILTNGEIPAAGKIDFYIDMSDSVHTNITYEDGVFTITAPLKDNIQFDLSTTTEIEQGVMAGFYNKNLIINRLSNKVLVQEEPSALANIKSVTASIQEQQLSKLVGKKVIITLTKATKSTTPNN